MTASRQIFHARPVLPDPEIPTLYTRPLCSDCQWLERNLPDGIKPIIQIMDISTVEGMTLAAEHEVLERYTPILVIDGRIIEGRVRIKQELFRMSAAGKKEATE